MANNRFPQSGSICDVPGIRVGHFHEKAAKTGCTVILPQERAVAGVDVRGSASGTREVDVLGTPRLVQKVDGVLLTGGSAFGLDAAGGVQQYLEENKRGFDTGIVRVPIVPAAVIFDLATGYPAVRPDKQWGYAACERASSQAPEEGLAGAGCGASVGKLLGMARASSGGIGTCSEQIKNGLIIGVLTVVNAFGEILDLDTNAIIAGVRDEDKDTFISALDILKKSGARHGLPSNTTLSVVATNARLTRDSATKVSQMAQNGLARVIRPAHTMFDGDVVFCLSTGEIEADINLIGAVACELVAESINRAVKVSNGKR